ERGEITRAVIGPRSGGAIVAASGLQSLSVEFFDRRVVGRAEGDVSPCTGRPRMRRKRAPRLALRPKTAAGIVARAQHVSERRQGRGVKAHTGVEIADFQSDVVVP